MPYKRISS